MLNLKSEKFSKKDLICRCGCGEFVFDARIWLFLKRLEDEKIDFRVSSGYRCKKHNSSKLVGGSPNSKHIYGEAVDIHFKRSDKQLLGRILEIVDDFQLRSLINYSWGIHVDTGYEPVFCYDISKYIAN
jgi:uncharacterized protein YcbK (DUF882 family)